MEEGQEDVDAAAKVDRLSRFATYLREQVEELKEQQQPSTPPEVIEERRKTTSEAIEWIKQGEKLCTETIYIVSAVWELFLKYEAMEKIKEDAWKDDLKISAVKEYMKTMPMKEKITRGTELKEILDKARTLHDQESMCNKEMAKQ